MEITGQPCAPLQSQVKIRRIRDAHEAVTLEQRQLDHQALIAPRCNCLIRVGNISIPLLYNCAESFFSNRTRVGMASWSNARRRATETVPFR